MPQYRRVFHPGGTFFLTIVTENRLPILTTELGRRLLHESIEACRVTRPFEINAIVLLPDHWHMMLTLPAGDADYPTRLASIKSGFTRAWCEAGGTEQPISRSKARARRRGVWQRHFWEHWIHSREDYNTHLDYIHFNPIKHGVARCAHEWPYSSFAKAVKARNYEPTWQCRCANRDVEPLDFSHLPVDEME